MQGEHLKLLGEKEMQKQREYEAKVQVEKESRDRQLKLEKQRKRAQDKKDYHQELELVDRLKKEMDAERQMLNDKREQEKMYLKKMLEENEKEKSKKLA